MQSRSVGAHDVRSSADLQSHVGTKEEGKVPRKDDVLARTMCAGENDADLSLVRWVLQMLREPCQEELHLLFVCTNDVPDVRDDGLDELVDLVVGNRGKLCGPEVCPRVVDSRWHNAASLGRRDAVDLLVSPHLVILEPRL